MGCMMLRNGWEDHWWGLKLSRSQSKLSNCEYEFGKVPASSHQSYPARSSSKCSFLYPDLPRDISTFHPFMDGMYLGVDYLTNIIIILCHVIYPLVSLLLIISLYRMRWKQAGIEDCITLTMFTLCHTCHVIWGQCGPGSTTTPFLDFKTVPKFSYLL